ncbi:hypothetical protein FKM82_026449 [Ascaphus truei]
MSQEAGYLCTSSSNTVSCHILLKKHKANNKATLLLGERQLQTLKKDSLHKKEKDISSLRRHCPREKHPAR